jgi:integrase/recombinase XerD
MKPSSNLAALIERYFTVRLLRQRNVSANTIASYRDTFRLLFTFAQAQLRKPPSTLALDDLDAHFVSAFLADLETKRGASVKTRNLRLTAIRSFFRFVSFEEPAHSALIQRVLAIPSKRHDKRQVHFLTRLDRDAVQLGAGAHVQCVGKGRKERCTPLTAHARGALQSWLKEPARHGANALFPNMHGGRLSADSVQSHKAVYADCLTMPNGFGKNPSFARTCGWSSGRRPSSIRHSLASYSASRKASRRSLGWKRVRLRCSYGLSFARAASLSARWACR